SGGRCVQSARSERAGRRLRRRPVHPAGAGSAGDVRSDVRPEGRPTMTPDVALPATQIPQTPPRVAARAVDAEQQAALDLLSTLDGDDWDRPTDCAGWTVRDLVAH